MGPNSYYLNRFNYYNILDFIKVPRFASNCCVKENIWKLILITINIEMIISNSETLFSR